VSAWLEWLGIVHLGLFLSAVLLLNLTPGPDTAYIVGRSLAQGRMAGVISALGICLGCCVHSVLCAFGLTALLAASASAFLVIKFIGAIYLVVLGVRLCWRSSKPDAGRPDAPVALKRAPKPQRAGHSLLVQGFLTNLFNPKVILFFVAFFPQFVTQASASKPLALLVLGAMFFFMSLLYNCSVAWLAGSITTRVRAVPGVALWLERMVGVAFVALGARLALIERPL
jgi:threonine/homoserine/homoserine lactone efflux protein